MIEPPKLYTSDRRDHDLFDIEVLGQFAIELGLESRPDIRQYFGRLIETAGTPLFYLEFKVIYDYVMRKRACAHWTPDTAECMMIFHRDQTVPSDQTLDDVFARSNEYKEALLMARTRTSDSCSVDQVFLNRHIAKGSSEVVKDQQPSSIVIPSSVQSSSPSPSKKKRQNSIEAIVFEKPSKSDNQFCFSLPASSPIQPLKHTPSLLTHSIRPTLHWANRHSCNAAMTSSFRQSNVKELSDLSIIRPSHGKPSSSRQQKDSKDRSPRSNEAKPTSSAWQFRPSEEADDSAMNIDFVNSPDHPAVKRAKTKKTPKTPTYAPFTPPSESMMSPHSSVTSYASRDPVYMSALKNFEYMEDEQALDKIRENFHNHDTSDDPVLIPISLTHIKPHHRGGHNLRHSAPPAPVVLFEVDDDWLVSDDAFDIEA